MTAAEEGFSVNTAENTHRRYNTVDHLHLDALVYQATGNFPNSGLALVECADGRWFVEVDFGVGFDQIEGVSKPKVTPYVEPRFFPDRAGALGFAFESIKQVHPDLRDVDLSALMDD